MLKRARPTLGAVAIAASVAGVTLLLLNPPSLSGAEDLLAIVAGAVALVLLSAWVTVTLIGRDSISEPEFERVVRRSERLAGEGDPARSAGPEARSPGPEAGSGGPEAGFDALVADAIDRLPEEFQRLLQDVPIVVSSRGREERAYGHYHGDTVARDDFEDRIVLYQDTLERDFGYDRSLLAAQIERTLRHELAHHLGWAERGVRGLGL